MEVVKFKAEHLAYIHKNGMNDVKLKPWLLPEHGAALEAYGGIFTILDEGLPVVFGGIVKYWENRGEAWLVFGRTDPQRFLTIFRIVRDFLDSSPLRRVEMVVDYGSETHARWARMLGFTEEVGRLRCYRPDGSDGALYSRIKSPSLRSEVMN